MIIWLAINEFSIRNRVKIANYIQIINLYINIIKNIYISKISYFKLLYNKYYNSQSYLLLFNTLIAVLNSVKWNKILIIIIKIFLWVL